MVIINETFSTIYLDINKCKNRFKRLLIRVEHIAFKRGIPALFLLLKHVLQVTKKLSARVAYEGHRVN